jgi:XTP/dITP diphosphohydrolase
VTVYCATTNPGKLREFRLAAEAWPGIAIETLPALDSVDAPEETGDTFEANALQKALYYSARAEGLLFAEDSGIEVAALGGAPGVWSARFAGPGATDEANNLLLLEKLRGNPHRAARYVCVVALAHRGRPVRTFRGSVEGLILDAPRGGGGFGYDPLFFYPPYDRTFGEVSAAEKLKVSHRSRALEALFEWLAQNPDGRIQ